MARPKAEINYKKVNEYLQAQCSGSTIAGILGIHPDTLYKAIEDKYKLGFSAYSAQKKSEGKEILKKNLWDIAIKGNVPMNIWLSKQYLGMTDKSNINIELEKLTDEQLEILCNQLIKKENEKR